MMRLRWWRWRYWFLSKWRKSHHWISRSLLNTSICKPWQIHLRPKGANVTLTCSKSVLYVLKWTLQCSRITPWGTIPERSHATAWLPIPSNRSPVLKGVKTIEVSCVPQSSPLCHLALSNMAPVRQQSQSLASPLGLSAPISPQDEENPTCLLGTECLDKLIKNVSTFDPVPGQPNNTETFLQEEEALDGYPDATGSDRFFISWINTWRFSFVYNSNTCLTTTLNLPQLWN